MIIDQVIFSPILSGDLSPALNRGAPITTAKWELRKNLPNCMPFVAREFGLRRNCTAQAEQISVLEIAKLDEQDGPIGELDDSRLRDLIRAIGYILDAECEPL